VQRLKVSASCPSCGAPLELQEGANVSRCPFCDLPLLFQSPNSILTYYLEPQVNQQEIPFHLDRYRKEKGESLSRRVDEMKLYYLPFWRFTSSIFYTQVDDSSMEPYQERTEAEILTREWDINFPANESNDFGLDTLGLRPEWLKLRLLTDKNLVKTGTVLNLELDSSSAKEKALESLELLMDDKRSSGKELILRLLDETLSLIYFPLWVVNFIAKEGKYYQIIDAITGRTLKQGSGYFELKENLNREFKEIPAPKIIPHRCPNCGWDLPVTPFHLIFPCENCSRIWEISANGYLPIKGEIAKLKDSGLIKLLKSVCYFPFWVFQARPVKEKDFPIQKLVELIPSEIGWFKVKDKSKPFLFYVPAFEIKNLSKIPALSLVLTRTQPDLETETWEKSKLNGAAMSTEDARKIAEMLWIYLISEKVNLHLDEWKELILENEKIVWYPYYEECNFLEDLVTGYTFQIYKPQG
jgi:predicted RNA-binding Zn-ribbon protein involved in translation (DUF1610 family)